MFIPNNAIITVAGTVGVGKSTFTSALAERLNFQTSFEKVEGNPYLEKFYYDLERKIYPNKWSFHLQIYFLAERFKEQKRMFDAGGGFVQDRSIYEDTEIFAKMLYDEGSMTKEDYETYLNLFNSMVLTPYFPKPNVLIYLDASLEQVMERLKKRGREMEQKTSLTYWKNLHERYHHWIENFNFCPVLKINIDEYDIVENIESIDPIIEKVKNMIK